jgi:hypothetical protein
MKDISIDRRSFLRGAPLLAASPLAAPPAIAKSISPAITATFDPPVWEGPSIGGYHSFQSLKDDMDKLVVDNAGFVSSFVLGTTYGQLPILGVRLEAQQSSKKRVLFIGGHHACERISVEVVYLLAKHLIDARRTGVSPVYLKEMEILFVPLLNPDGHVYATSANWNWRKNRSPQSETFGVDLNRNYSVGFGTGEGSNVPELWDYRGPSAFSEFETQAVAKLFDKTDQPIHALITYHSFSQYILYPWGSRAYGGGDARIDGLISISNRMAAASLAAGANYLVGPASKFYSETVGGDLCDWALEKHGSLGLTVELPPQNDSASYGFKLPASQIRPAFDGHMPAALTFLEWVAGRL